MAAPNLQTVPNWWVHDVAQLGCGYPDGAVGAVTHPALLWLTPTSRAGAEAISSRLETNPWVLPSFTGGFGCLVLGLMPGVGPGSPCPSRLPVVSGKF